VPHPIPNLHGWRLTELDETGSTNADALAAAKIGDPGKLWIRAARQVQGKGRQGRPWVSKRGNLYCSLLLIDPAHDLEKLGTLPLAVACAVHGTLASLPGAGRHEFRIKWPNDILANGKKISGILLESLALEEGRMAVAIGIGINCAHHPEPALYQATDLAELGIEMSPEALFTHLASTMAATLDAWNHGRGFPQIRAEWLRLARGVGEKITVNLPSGPLDGVFEDIDATGRLVLRLQNSEIRHISAGDVFFAPARLS
jgi:BirA family transcriptional regulator, biotin operon repressor / biotin---[acetyl-CoA-carboxylase] ligase